MFIFRQKEIKSLLKNASEIPFLIFQRLLKQQIAFKKIRFGIILNV